MKRGLLLFAHGARDPQWAVPFQAVAHRATSLMPGVTVMLAFLEFMAPDLPAAAADLAALGCAQVDVVPLFLGAGGHVRRDLPEMMDALRAQYPHIQWRLHRAAGEDPQVIEALARVAVSAPQETT